MYASLILDDEPGARELLKKLLNRFHPEFISCYEAASLTEAIDILTTYKIDLIFLDLNLGNEFGLDLVPQIAQHTGFIVTTAHPEHALSALKNSALDYLLKPIQLKELHKTLGKFKAQKEKEHSRHEQLLEVLVKHAAKGKIMVPHIKGVRVIDIQDIIFLEGEGNYTYIQTTGEKILSSKTLKEYETLLLSSGFYRIHRSNMVNLQHIRELIYEDGGIVILTGNYRIPVSRRRLQEFKDELQKLQHT